MHCAAAETNGRLTDSAVSISRVAHATKKEAEIDPARLTFLPKARESAVIGVRQQMSRIDFPFFSFGRVTYKDGAADTTRIQDGA